MLPRQDNFYTLTVYEKGAEIVRMYHTLLGVEGFRCTFRPIPAYLLLRVTSSRPVRLKA